jgi:predicted nucleotidyltransferase component of viral defense system
LTGGAALAGFHLGHRTTRDLDLFWHGCDSIADVRREVMARLRSAGFEVSTLRTMDAFSTVNVTHGGESVVVDLVAEPVASIEPPQLTEHRGVSILVDTVHEVLVNKLCALLHRSELRDLVDIRALLDAGGDLDRAVADAPAKDGGFSALTLGWTMKSWSVADAARAAGLESRAIELEQFRDELLVLVAGRRP